MSILQILTHPDKRLRKTANQVTNIKNKKIQRIIDDMFETMYVKQGIGLAATQVNIHKQIIVVDIWNNKNKSLVCINPCILYKRGKTGIIEGCLSVPNQQNFVPRAALIKIRALDRNGNIFEIAANKLLAICIQHEIDHLIGKLLIDY